MFIMMLMIMMSAIVMFILVTITIRIIPLLSGKICSPHRAALIASNFED